MLRLAALLGADDPENIAAEAYYQMYRKWRKLRDAESAEAYLRSIVCNLTRMRIRHLQVAPRHTEAPPTDWITSAENSALLHDDQRVLVEALQQLPTRQREALEALAGQLHPAPDAYRTARGDWLRRERRRRLVLTILITVVFALAVLLGLWVLNQAPTGSSVIFSHADNPTVSAPPAAAGSSPPGTP